MEKKKVSKRRKSREQALAALFQIFLGKNDLDIALQYVAEDSINHDFLKELVQGVVQHQEEIDAVIKENTKKWSIERFGNVELNAIRIATFELMHKQETPPKVVMNEAIEVIKTFSDDKSAKFANSILQKISDQIRGA